VISHFFLQAFTPVEEVFSPNHDPACHVNLCSVIRDCSHPALSEILGDINVDVNFQANLADHPPLLDRQSIGSLRHSHFLVGRAYN
jgi:hypothetical protein